MAEKKAAAKKAEPKESRVQAAERGVLEQREAYGIVGSELEDAERELQQALAEASAKERG